MSRFRYVFIGLFAVYASLVVAEPLRPSNVPEPLKPWVDWVLHDQQQFGCPFVFNQFEQKQCYWPSRLELDFGPTQGYFVGQWVVQRDSWIWLPGEAEHWPQQVRVNQKAAAVVAKEGRPALKLAPGQYIIQGEFVWDYIPEQLQLPADVGLVTLSINGVVLPTPPLKEGVLWLKDSERGNTQAAAMQDNLSLHVYRQIIDEVPLQVLTRLELDVAGSAREAKLPLALLPGAIPMQLSSELPARLENDGQLLLQLRPGHWQVDLSARYPQAVTALNLPTQADWPESEIWVLAARPELRVIEVEGLSAIDASQTTLPAEWANLPAYRIAAGQSMQFKELRRGNPDPEPNQLQLTRKLWLDFDGQGYSINDHISGQMTNGWRLNSLPETQLGKVTLDGNSQLITQTQTGSSGVEVRQGQLNVAADSRYSGAIGQLSASGWQHPFQQLRAELNLPPGWQLLAASGVDNVPESWLARWTLLDLFMVLIAALAIAKLWHKALGLLALLTLGLIWHEAGAPHWIWLHILAATALLRVLPVGRIQGLINNYRQLCGVALLLMVLPFALEQVRLGLYPQLAMPWQTMQAADYAAGGSAPVAEMAMMAEQAAAPAAPDADYSARNQVAKVYKRALATAKAVLDVDSNVQTGPGLPQWQWHKVHLSWNGVVDSQQQLHLWYASPRMTLVLNFVRVLLLALLIAALFGQAGWLQRLPLGRFKQGLSMLVLGAVLVPSQPVKAELPPQPVLDELKSRLLVAPECLPSCAEIAHLYIDISPTQLSMTLHLAAQEAVSLPLPAQQQQWLPSRAKLDGEEHVALARDSNGQLWLQVSPGQHLLFLSGALPVEEKFTLSLPLKPHQVSVKQDGWAVSGIHEHGTADQQLQFSRLNASADVASSKFTPSQLPPLFKVERTLQLGLDWRVQTQVERVTPADAAAVLEIPLLPGESVVTAGMRTAEQRVVINMDAQQTTSQWESVLAKATQLELVAPATQQWTEVWRLDISPVWHLQTSGLAPIHPGQASSWLPEWRPWPGEKVSLQLSRPQALEGQTLTLERSELLLTPGARLTEANLTLSLQSSRGGQHTLLLPAGAELQTVSIDGSPQPLRLQERKLSLPLKPGAQTWQLNWRQTQDLPLLYTTPGINVGLNGVNSHTTVNLAQDRWVLMTLGPRLGPAVLFWGIFLVFALVAFGLAKTQITPLNCWQWFLLWIGLSQIPLVFAWLVPAWLLLLGKRTHIATQSQQALVTATELKQRRRTTLAYNALQLLLIILTLAAASCLFAAVEQGLLGSPEMQIMGNNSSAYHLSWYQDRSLADLPQASVLSVPLWVYRGLMLAWSLWLALSLLQWLQWAWQAFASKGVWWSLPAKTED